MNTPRVKQDSPSFLRFAGYGLLVVGMIHIADVFIPPQFRNAAWEIGMVSLLLERMPLALIGVALVFLGGATERSKVEMLLLKVISWLTLIVGVSFFLLIPLGVSAFVRLNEQANDQINAQYEQQILQLGEAQTRLDTAESSDLQLLLETFRAQDEFASITTPQALKSRLGEEIKQARQEAADNRKAAQKRERLGLQQTVIKSSFISLVSSYMFIYVWYKTIWARKSKLK